MEVTYCEERKLKKDVLFVTLIVASPVVTICTKKPCIFVFLTIPRTKGEILGFFIGKLF
jgi:hypothetical protein